MLVPISTRLSKLSKDELFLYENKIYSVLEIYETTISARPLACLKKIDETEAFYDFRWRSISAASTEEQFDKTTVVFRLGG